MRCHVDGEVDADAQSQGGDHDRHHVPLEAEQHHGTDHPERGKHHGRKDDQSRNEPTGQEQKHHEGHRQRNGRGFQLRHAEAGQDRFQHDQVPGHVHLSKAVQIGVKTVLTLDAFDHGDEGGHNSAGVGRVLASTRISCRRCVTPSSLIATVASIRPSHPGQRVGHAGVALQHLERTKEVNGLA